MTDRLASSSRAGQVFAALAVILVPLAVFAPLGLAPLLMVTALALLLTAGRRCLGALVSLAPLAGLLTLLALWGMLSALWSILPQHSLLEGLRFLGLSAAGLVVLAGGMTLEPGERARLASAASIGVGLAILLLFVEYLGTDITALSRFDRGATTLALALAPALLGLGSRGRRALAILLAVLAVALLLQLNSATAKLAAPLGLAFGVLAWRLPRLVALSFALGTLLLAVALPLVVPDYDRIAALHVEAPWVKWSGIHRLGIWRFTAERIAERPLLGWGMDAARELPGAKASLAVIMPKAELDPGALALPLHPHNAALQWRVELGLPGTVLCLAALLWILWRVGWRAPLAPAQRAAALGLAGAALVIAMLSYGFWQSWWQSCLWLVAALLAAAGPQPPPAATGTSRPKLIYLVTEDWYFWSHRLPMAQAARAAGFDVAVATRVRDHGALIRAAGFTLHPLGWRRRSISPWATLAAILEISRLYRHERPVIVHHVALKPAILGGIAALIADVPAVVNAVTGVGFVASSPSRKARLLRRLVSPVLARLLERGNSRVIVQNEDDRRLLLALHPGAGERIAVIRGSGVDTEHFRPAAAPPAPPVVAAFVGRMLVDKGVPTLVEAQQRLQRRGIDVRLLLAGTPDPENPTSLAPETLAQWQSLPGISWLGQQDDIRKVWAAAHIAVLPSRREGLPKSLLEAAAMGLPIIATDVPGCREIAHQGANALLVPPDDAEALAAALAELAADAGLRERFGAASRHLVESDLSSQAVGAATTALYLSLLDALALPSPLHKPRPVFPAKD